MKVTRKSRLITALLLSVALAVWIVWLRTQVNKPLQFDDSFMFYRYAINFRHGLGISWNLDGVHTYGMTSPLWGVLVLLLSYLPISISKALILGSWMCSAGAIIAIAWAVARNAQSEYMSSLWRVLPMVALPLVFTRVFLLNTTTGMETMLAALLVAVFIGLALASWRGGIYPEVAGIAGLLLFLTRPEAAIAIVLLPLLVWFLFPGGMKRDVVRLLGVFLPGVLLDLLICKLYYHTSLPLSFYMKSRHAYIGYAHRWYPVDSLMNMISACGLYLITIAYLSRKADWRLVVSCLVPALATFGYLCTVTQIMGFNSRYYVPYFAFFVIPALLLIDKHIKRAGELTHEQQSGREVLANFAAVGVAFFFIQGLYPKALLVKIDRHLEGRMFAYDSVHLDMDAATPLPLVGWARTIPDITDLLVKPLPRGATIAASEVGYLGANALQANVIDLSGLNDSEIASHGFNINTLMARKPDIIWMPHTDYTYQRGLILSDPTLLKEYDVYAGAADYSIAICKTSPFHREIDHQMHVLWNQLYPGFLMKDYLVKSATWTRQKYRLAD